MSYFEHFSHPHKLSFYRSLEDAALICTGCKFPCARTPIYSCRPCNFFLHDHCFGATRALIHQSHSEHPLTLAASPTYTYGSFLCNSCKKTGSGFSFCCSTCEFDLHIHCAYNDLKPKPGAGTTPNQIQLRSHPNHKLDYLTKGPYASGSGSCNVCGISCDADSPMYHCDVCNYDAHVDCINLPETVQRGDHEHTLTLLHVNPYWAFQCDICKGGISKTNCMYICTSGCNYGMHVKCVDDEVSEESPINEQMRNLHDQLLVNQMTLLALRGIYPAK